MGRAQRARRLLALTTARRASARWSRPLRRSLLGAEGRATAPLVPHSRRCPLSGDPPRFAPGTRPISPTPSAFVMASFAVHRRANARGRAVGVSASRTLTSPGAKNRRASARPSSSAVTAWMSMPIGDSPMAMAVHGPDEDWLIEPVGIPATRGRPGPGAISTSAGSHAKRWARTCRSHVLRFAKDVAAGAVNDWRLASSSLDSTGEGHSSRRNSQHMINEGDRLRPADGATAVRGARCGVPAAWTGDRPRPMSAPTPRCSRGPSRGGRPAPWR